MTETNAIATVGHRSARPARRANACTVPASRWSRNVRLFLLAAIPVLFTTPLPASADTAFARIDPTVALAGTPIAVWHANRSPETVFRRIEDAASSFAESGALRVYGPRELTLAGGPTPLHTAMRAVSWLGVLQLSERSVAWVAVGPSTDGTLVRYGIFEAEPDIPVVASLERAIGSILPERWQSPEQRFRTMVRRAMEPPAVGMSDG